MRKALLMTSKETHQRKKCTKSLNVMRDIKGTKYQKDTLRSLIKRDQDTPKGKKRSHEEETGLKKTSKSLRI